MGERNQVDPGVVDPGTQRSLRLGRVGGPAVIFADGYVTDDGKKAIPQASGRLRQGLLVAVEADHCVADLKQPLSHSEPDPVSRAGDDG